MGSSEQINLLIVDDFPNNLQVLANSLKDKNYRIALATSGQQALEIIKESKFDLILLDIMMPGMSGIEVCQILKADEKTKSIPVIFLTAYTDTEKIIEGFNAGAVDYITKPFNDKELIKRVETHIELRKKTEQLIELNEHLEEMVMKRTNELNIEKKRAEIANRAKTLFLANMNHELRTPLNSIMGFSSLLEEAVLNEEQAEYVNIISNSSHDLLKLITEILEYTNIESSVKELNLSSFSPAEMIAGTIDSLKIQAIRKGLYIKNNVQENLPEVIADELKIKQILTSFISNAIKFTLKGGVEINASVQDIDSGKQNLVITVSDTGVGIFSEKIDMIFEEFYQVDEDFTRQFGGLGLGLSLAKKQADFIGGKITVESEVGKGSSFTLTIPVSKTAKTVTVKKEEANSLPQKLKILVAEDNLMNQELIRLVLQQKGYEVTIAANGKIALELAGKNKYDLIFMDIQMPVMDGIEATRKIRKLDHYNEIPIIAFTAHTLPEDREMCFDAGMNDMINKPLRKDVVYDIIIRYCGG